ncbi:hypothetical protein [Demequina activiva]|uniref:hypothetical protein n=1 Tax=Demequina activiva TaxID=1582364 RepID=UPI0019438A60|nr:hypothetical protein [Demequina activiva]
MDTIVASLSQGTTVMCRRGFRRADDGTAADARARVEAMVAYRSRQLAYENRFALVLLLGCAGLCAAIFTVGAGWRQAPWLCAGTLALLLCLLAVPLTVTVDDTHLRVRLAGALRRDIALADVRAVERREYAPVREFGGWGWRWGLTHRNARAYTTTGTTAVVLTLRDSQEVYLGVEDEAALLDLLSARIAS